MLSPDLHGYKAICLTGKILFILNGNNPEMATIVIYSSLGQMLVERPVIDNNCNINIEKFHSGMYLILIKSANKTHCAKFLKE